MSRSSLGQSAQRLTLVTVLDLCILSLVSAEKVSASRLGSWSISSCQDVSCMPVCDLCQPNIDDVRQR